MMSLTTSSLDKQDKLLRAMLSFSFDQPTEEVGHMEMSLRLTERVNEERGEVSSIEEALDVE